MSNQITTGNDTRTLAQTLVATLRAAQSPRDAAGQRRFGICPSTEQLGVRIPTLRALAKQHRGNQPLALLLWDSGIHDARLLAAFIGDPQAFTVALMTRWAQSFDSWDLCDQVCSNLFDRHAKAPELAPRFCRAEAEFHRRAGFVMMAAMAVHRKDLNDDVFLGFLPIIEQGATDPRNFVKKAVHWALRQIGKRNAPLHTAALVCAQRLQKSASPAARFVAQQALRELENPPAYCRRRLAQGQRDTTRRNTTTPKRKR